MEGGGGEVAEHKDQEVWISRAAPTHQEIILAGSRMSRWEHVHCHAWEGMLTLRDQWPCFENFGVTFEPGFWRL